MDKQKQKMIELLQFNKGFSCPGNWINYGIKHNFKKVKADKIEKCPDCAAQSLNFIGQYVYYSTLVKLLECAHCQLVFSDTRIDAQVIQSHFEQAYKDEIYFKHKRRRIFEQISGLADINTPPGGKILDVGGAKGHLLADLKTRRPDIGYVLNDLSKEACEHAASEYGFLTIVGGINELEKFSSRFDVVIMSDVIYYEPELRKLWAILPSLLSNNGTVIIRVPNKLTYICYWQFVVRILAWCCDNEMQDKIKFFNPEHLYVFSRYYLLTRLKKFGFSRVIIIPSELLVNERGNIWHSIYYFFSKIIWFLSFRRLLLTPSLLVVAKNFDSKEKNGDQPKTSF